MTTYTTYRTVDGACAGGACMGGASPKPQMGGGGV